MSNSRLGNNLLYLLSEKRSLKWSFFKRHIEDLARQSKTTGYSKKGHQIGYSKILGNSVKTSFQKQADDSWQLARDMSAMAYLDIGGKTGETVVKIAPPMLAELPFWEPAFLLTGARSPELLEIIKKSVKKLPKTEIEIKSHGCLPYTVFIKAENKPVLRRWLDGARFQGNSLSDYIKISPRPPAWDMLEFSGSLTDYKEFLNEEWFGGSSAHIKAVFDIGSLKFKPFDADKNRLEHDLSLVKIFHQENYYKYYLFSKTKQEKAEVQLDWGKFIIAKRQGKAPVLEYKKKSFELISHLRLPALFERGLTLLSGQPPEKTQEGPEKFVFQKVPYEIALLVINKLGQNYTGLI